MSRPKIPIRETLTTLSDGTTSPRWYFVVIGSNGEPITTSELYTRKDGARRGRKALRRAVLLASMGDES